MIAGNKPSNKAHSMALTLDDGYRNQLTYALSILKKFSAQATLLRILQISKIKKNSMKMMISRQCPIEFIQGD